MKKILTLFLMLAVAFAFVLISSPTIFAQCGGPKEELATQTSESVSTDTMKKTSQAAVPTSSAAGVVVAVTNKESTKAVPADATTSASVATAREVTSATIPSGAMTVTKYYFEETTRNTGSSAVQSSEAAIRRTRMANDYWQTTGAVKIRA